MIGGAIAVTWGNWGGIYFYRGYTKKLCLGFLAVTYYPRDLDRIIGQLIDRAVTAEHRAEQFERTVDELYPDSDGDLVDHCRQCGEWSHLDESRLCPDCLLKPVDV